MPTNVKKLACLTPDAINIRFAAASDFIGRALFKHVTKGNPWADAFHSARVARLMAEKKCSRKKALAILAKERAAWVKHYDSPLGKAERRIQELETHLANIKALVENPDHFDNP